MITQSTIGIQLKVSWYSSLTDLKDEIDIHIWNENILKKDDCLGYVRVSLSNVLKIGYDSITLPVTRCKSGKKKGQISVKLLFFPKTETKTKKEQETVASKPKGLAKDYENFLKSNESSIGGGSKSKSKVTPSYASPIDEVSLGCLHVYYKYPFPPFLLFIYSFCSFPVLSFKSINTFINRFNEHERAGWAASI